MLRKGNIMTIVYILLAILILELLIFLHELGHFTAGKLLGFRILGFSDRKSTRLNSSHAT